MKALVTGGAGFIGSHLVDELVRKKYKVIVLDNLSTGSLKNLKFVKNKIKFIKCDLSQKKNLTNLLHGVDYVFHAAALKQVPTCEFFPMQATQTNVQGSKNVIDSAISHGVAKVVSLSTDKAVYPVNALGITKALMEKVVQATSRKLSEGQTILTLVRYGIFYFPTAQFSSSYETD